MMKELKMAFKLMKYGHQFKLYCVFVTILLIVQIPIIFTSSAGLMTAVGLNLVNVLILGETALDTLRISDFVAASSKRRFLEITLIDIWEIISPFAVYLSLALIAAGKVKKYSYFKFEYTVAMVYISVLIGILLVMSSLKHKFASSGIGLSVAFIVAWMSYFWLFEITGEMKEGYLQKLKGLGISINLTGAIICGCFVILISCILSMIFRRIFYKRALAKYSDIGRRKAKLQTGFM